MDELKKKHFNSLSNNLIKPIAFDDVLKPYRVALITGDIQQQKIIISKFVSSLLANEISRLTEERRSCKEEALLLLEIFTCNLCRELFYLPVTLVCGHTFCLVCLEIYQQQGRTICPGCGEESRLRYTLDILLQELLCLWFPENSIIRNCVCSANELLRQGRMEEFMKITKSLMMKYPENSDILYLYANANKFTKNYCDALKFFNHACNLAPFCSKNFYARGELLASLGATEEAIAMFLRAFALKPNESMYHCSLIICLKEHLKIVCYSNTPLQLSPVLTYNTNIASAVKRVGNFSPLESTLNINESRIVQNIPSRRQVCYEAQIEHGTNESGRADTIDNGDEPGRASANVDSLCFRIGKKENVDCTEKSTTFPPKSNIESELECKVCFNLIYEPVTTPCGHTLCRSCLRRCLDHRFNCPCCRENLQTYLEHLMLKNIGTSKVLESILVLKFNDNYQERRFNHENELFEFSRCDRNINEIPIFVCTFAAPFINCPLHVFKPCHKLMLRRCLESGSRQFGMCAPDNQQGFASFGTTLHIKDVSFLSDGRSIVHAVGSKRFKVLERGLRDGCNIAKVVWLEDECANTDYTELNYEVYNMMSHWYEKLPDEHKTCIVDAIGHLPDEQQRTSKNGPNWLWWLLVAIPLNLEAKQIILSMTSVTERLQSLKRFLAILLNRQ